MSARHLARLLVAFVLLGVLVSFARRVGAVERNFAGSGQFDYHYVVNGQSPGGITPRDGFTTELALKVAVDVTDKVSANVKVCYGCHGFEVPMAHLDYRVADELNFRVGRFSPSLGAFNLRHDPANHRLSSKPLIYDMGRMLRKNEWNMGVLPSPFPDNGVEVSGTHWFGESVQLDYALYAVSGFKAASDATDLDFQLNRQPYYTDNNSRPTVGGRLALTFKLGEASDLTVGGSSQYGTFDPDRKQSYWFYGADASLRLSRTNIRVEWLARRQTFDASDPTRFAYVVPKDGGDFFVKQGGYAEIEHPLGKKVDGVFRYDVMYRTGNVLVGSELRRQSAVQRFTVGAMVTVDRAFRVKASTEIWQFSDPEPGDKLAPRSDVSHAVAFHLGVVGTY
ncbi:MAG: hypothetical protein JNL79_02385 [Myxococcales bacterium]|nr:hypothetical protein [Myxococcales bacterium]